MDTFEIGDYVTIKSSCRIISAASHLYYLQMWNAIGRVIPNYNGNSDRIFVRFQFNDSVVDGEVDGMFPADELELADIAALSSETPAEPGGDAKDYTYPEYVTEFAPEHGNTDKPERKMPFMGTRSYPCCKERDALIAERDKLLLSEQRYHEEVERLRAGLQEIVDLPEDSFKSAWSIAVAALAMGV